MTTIILYDIITDFATLNESSGTRKCIGIVFSLYDVEFLIIDYQQCSIVIPYGSIQLAILYQMAIFQFNSIKFSQAYFDSEQSTEPMGVPALPEMSGIVREDKAFSSIGIATCRTEECKVTMITMYQLPHI